VSFLECDWTDVIAPHVLAQFASDIERRRKNRHEKEAREERDRIRAEEEEEKRYAAARRRRPSVIEKSFSESDFQPLAHAEANFGGSPSGSHAISMTPPWGASRNHSSFASLASPGTSPEAPRTVWGTTVIPPSSPPITATPQETAVSDDGWLQGWEKDLLDNGDPVTMVESSAAGGGTSSRSGAAVSGKQKKKNKKITLMSTNARRGA
jgi:hypothetical protein